MQSIKSFRRSLFAAIVMLSANYHAYGYDLPGSDIVGSDVQNADQCAATCNDPTHSDCLAWTFVRAGKQGPSARCYLKHNPVPAPSWNSVCQTNFDCVSGYKQTNWCGDKAQGDVLSCSTGTSCKPRMSKSCSGWWIFRSCTTLSTTEYFCQ